MPEEHPSFEGMRKEISMKMIHRDDECGIVYEGPMMNWYLNRRCNFKCTYCFISHEELSLEHPACGTVSPAKIRSSFDRTGLSWWIHLSGGEPFLFPNFLELCQELTRNHTVSINSNLSTNNVEEFAHSIDPAKVHFISASLHIEQRSKRPEGVRKFIDRVLYLQERGFPVYVNYVAYPPLFHRMEKDIQELREAGCIHVNTKRFTGFHKGKHYPSSYTAEESALIKKYAIHSDTEEYLFSNTGFLGKTCDAGWSFLKMNQQGDVFRCDTSNRVLGNFFDKSFVMPDRPKACPFVKCRCLSEGAFHIRSKNGSPVELMGEVIKEYPTYLKRELNPRVNLRRVRKLLGRDNRVGVIS